MKLAPISVPYRAFQKGVSLLILVFFLGSSDALPLEIATAAGVLVVAVTVGYELAYYKRFDYELTEDTFDIHSGVVSRRDREIPYRRIQNVDISRNVIQRVLGIAAVDLETAGGSATEGTIRYVTAEQAQHLQREIQRRKADRTGLSEETTSSEDADADASADTTSERDRLEETELFALSASELALVGALSFDLRLVGLIAFLASGSVPILSGLLPELTALVVTITGIVVVGILLVVSWLIGAAMAISNYYGFRLFQVGDELRYERGLFRRYSGSIPTEKVQRLSIVDNPMKRLVDYATLTIETAGYAPGQGGSYGSQAAVPLARRERVLDLAREVEPFGDPDFVRPPSRIRVRYAFQYTLAVGVLLAVGFGLDRYLAYAIPWEALVALLVVVPAAAHYKWKHRGYWVGEDHLLTRIGFWKRETMIVPYYRIQTVIDTRTVFQRRWNVATVVADTAGTGGFVGRDAAAIDIGIEDAERLRTELTDELQASLVERRERRNGTDRFEWTDLRSVRDADATGPNTTDVNATDLSTTDEE